MKDNFSKQSGAYSKFRPVYPDTLYACLYEQVNIFERAWDCGTGNGQVAGILADQFQDVEATDISQKQLDRAKQKDNIHYSLQAAETALFPPNHFDLITVGQAIHWFDHDRFYTKVKDCLRPNGLLAEFGYQLFRVDETVNRVIDYFDRDLIGPYWDAERRHIDEAYATIPFPFASIATPNLSMQYEWSLEQTIGYLTTWSSVQHYRKAKGHDPVELIRERLTQAWGESAMKTINFRILLRLGTH